MAEAAEEAGRDQVRAFMAQVQADAGGLMAVVLAAMGERLGLFGALADGAASSAALAERAGCHERYVREWADGLVAAGYLVWDAASGSYDIAPAARPALADPGGPLAVGGMFEAVHGLLGNLDGVIDAFRNGGGVAQADMAPTVFTGMARTTGAFHDHALVQQALPAVPGLLADLERGLDVVDVGCGRGRAAIRLAEAFPACRITGVDAFADVVAAAAAAAEEAGVGGRVRFVVGDAAAVLPPADLVTTFDVVHDLVDPPALARAVRAALPPGGRWLILEPNSGDGVAANVGPQGTWRYGVSLLYCLTTSLAQGGAGLGTCGTPEPALRALVRDAGFADLTRVYENAFNALYVATP